MWPNTEQEDRNDGADKALPHCKLHEGRDGVSSCFLAVSVHLA